MSDKGTEREPNDFGEPWKLDEDDYCIRDREGKYVIDLVHCPEHIWIEAIARFNALEGFNLSNPDKETQLILRLIKAKAEDHPELFDMTLDDLFEARKKIPGAQIGILESYGYQEAMKKIEEQKRTIEALNTVLHSYLEPIFRIDDLKSSH